LEATDVLRVVDLVKTYGDTLALDRVTFEVGRGEVVGFLGPNGAGKTTTMRIITGFIPPTSGVARVDGRDVFTESLAVRRSIGYLPENVPVYTDMRVGEYLRFRAQLKGVPRRERRRDVERVLDRCLLKDHEGQLIGTLSKGYRQRVGLADALLGSPKLLVLDEPTSGMDPNQVREVRRLLRELGADHTVLLSTHILPEVEAVCSRALIIHQGRLVANEPVRAGEVPGTELDLEAIGPEEEIQRALQAIPGVASLRASSLGGGAARFRIAAEAGKDLREAIGRKALEVGFVIRELRPLAQRLEDLFVRYTAGERAAEGGEARGAQEEAPPGREAPVAVRASAPGGRAAL
jgi:ABC-2 type transport system ATP-binding protein